MAGSGRDALLAAIVYRQLPPAPEEEKMYLEHAAAGDAEARNILIERNLRLVAHIMNKG